MSNDICTVNNCTKPIKRKGFCYGHYMKQWRYGTPTPEFEPKWEDIRGERFGSLTVVEREGSMWLCQCDCGRQRTATAGELNRTGEASTCGHRATHRRKPDAGYTAAHERVRRDRGSVTDRACVECGGPARHWSYDHTDPDELYAHGLSRNPLAYSLSPVRYSPRCVPCHKRFDLGRPDAGDRHDLRTAV